MEDKTLIMYFKHGVIRNSVDKQDIWQMWKAVINTKGDISEAKISLL